MRGRGGRGGDGGGGGAEGGGREKEGKREIDRGELRRAREREGVRLSLSAFLGTEDIKVHIVHISRVIISYTLELLS